MKRVHFWAAMKVACLLTSAALCSCGGAEANYYFPASCRMPRWFSDIPRASVDVEVAAYINERGRELVFDVYSQKRERLVRKTASERGLEPIRLTLAAGTQETFEVLSADGVTDVIRFVYSDPHGVSICTVDDPDVWRLLGLQKQP